tara:strand:- start:13956 stop:14264 length:309 start_codon:yes stop_codon:yes gene_type:complete
MNFLLFMVEMVWRYSEQVTGDEGQTQRLERAAVFRNQLSMLEAVRPDRRANPSDFVFGAELCANGKGVSDAAKQFITVQYFFSASFIDLNSVLKADDLSDQI